jgi:hypothetical protein
LNIKTVYLVLSTLHRTGFSLLTVWSWSARQKVIKV